eukprot:TRINITY_DN21500_c0_g2_i1.p1 TRINITY_DN21500_c0_g2~~TRINITY_DN21500_c0_g2_i1.p1  ORF type:complete len:637 (-),score=81.72 TRINITY_DN21500_c0_g2_i1:123-2033(-)
MPFRGGSSGVNAGDDSPAMSSPESPSGAWQKARSVLRSIAVGSRGRVSELTAREPSYRLEADKIEHDLHFLPNHESQANAHLPDALEPGATGDKAYLRHECCWGFLVGCLCPGPSTSWRCRRPKEESVAEQQRKLVIQHLAQLSTQFTRDAPGARVWANGLRRLSREMQAEDEEEYQTKLASGGPSLWLGPHRDVLDLGVQPPLKPSSSSSASPCSTLASETEAAGAKTRLVDDPLQDVAEASAHFARFAVAAYARKMYALMRPFSALSFLCCNLSEEDCFARLAEVSPREILFSRHFAEPFKPSWWLCLDHASRAVVIAIRGTFSTHDCLSDVFARQVQYRQHVVHQGVLASAVYIRDKVLPMLERVAELRADGYRLVLSGHSLGGAVAALLAWMLRGEDRGGNAGQTYEAFCFAYGAPMVMDRALADKLKRFVVCVVHNKDVAPRLSTRSLELLRDRIADDAEPSRVQLRRLEAVLSRFGLPHDPDALDRVLGRSLAGSRLARSSSDPFEDALDDVASLPAVPMYCPGLLLHVRRRGRSARAKVPGPIIHRGSVDHYYLTVWTPDASFFHKIRPAWTMWTDHWPQTYLFVCQAFAERLGVNLRKDHTSGGKGAVSLSDVLRRVEALLLKHQTST